MIYDLRFHCKDKGYVALLSVLLIGAVGTVIGVTLVMLGLGASRTSYALVQSTEAKSLANACAEEALMKIRESTSFTGTATVNLGNGSCIYTVTNTGGQTRSVTASGSVGTIVRKVSINISAINPQITISSWQEIP